MTNNISNFKDSTPLCTMENPKSANSIIFIEKPRDPWHLIHIISFRKSTGVINFQLLTTMGGMKARIRTYEASGFHIVESTNQGGTKVPPVEIPADQDNKEEVTPPAPPAKPGIKRKRRRRTSFKGIVNQDPAINKGQAE